MLKNAKAGHFNGGPVPYGYQSVPDENAPNRKKLIPVPGEALLVEKIFNMKLVEHSGARTIAYQLNLSGHAYRDKKWTKGKVANILNNPVVIGQIVFNRKNRATGRVRPRPEWIIVNSHEPIISMDIWERTQAALGIQKDECVYDDRHSPFIASKLLRCGECGSPMTIESAKGRSKRYHYYVCNAARYEKAHKPERFPADALDQWLIETFCEQVFNLSTLEDIIVEVKQRASSWAQDSKQERTVLYREIDDIDKRRRNLFSILEKLGQDAPNLMDMSERLQELKARKVKCESRISELDADNAPKVSASAEDVINMRNFLLDVIKTAPPRAAKKFLQTFVNKITMNHGDVEITYDPEKLAQTTGVVRLKRNWLPVVVTKRTILLSLPKHIRPRRIRSPIASSVLRKNQLY